MAIATATATAVVIVIVIVIGVAIAIGIPACGAGPEATEAEPESLFARAERLRLVYEEEASQRAIRAYRDARDTWVRRGDPASAADASRGLGATHEQLGRLADAHRDYLEAAALCGEICDPLVESAIASDIGLVQAAIADDDASLQEALQYCQTALSLAREAGGAREEAAALSCAGEVEYYGGHLDQALELHLEAKAVWESISDPRGRAEAMYYEGAVRSDLSQFEAAKTSLEGALSFWAASGDIRGEAMALRALGGIEFRRGEHQEALNLLRQALDRLEPSGDLVWESSTLGGIGAVYLNLGDGAQARSYFEPALERFQRTGLVTATWDLLLGIGSAYLLQDSPAEAFDHFQQALELAEKKEKDRWKQAYSLQRMSVALQSLGEPDESLRCLEGALALKPSAEDPRLEAAIRMELGHTHELLENPTRAAESFRLALQMSRAGEDPAGESTALFGLARLAEREGDLDVAVDYVERALDVAELLRSRVASWELRTSYFASVYRFHELYIDLLMQLSDGRPEEKLDALAFGVSERARARSLLESLIESGVDVGSGVDPSLRDRESASRRRLDAAVERRLRADRTTEPEEIRALTEEVADLESRHDLVLAEIRSRSPRYAALARREPLGLNEVQNELLDDDTLLLEYALGEKRSYLWAVSKDGYASYELGPRAEIEEEAEHLYELLTARARGIAESLQHRERRLRETDAAYWNAALRASDRLLGPVADRLEGRKLVVVPHGALQHLPFGALPVPGRARDLAPLITAHEIVNLPSASALAVLREETLGRVRPGGTVAVFADPVFARDDPRLDGRAAPVPGARRALDDGGSFREGGLGFTRLEATRQEAADILALAPEGTTFHAVDFDANRSAAMSEEMGHYRILHFATHGVSNVDNPTMSGVLLSMFDEQGRARDGFLRLHDIYDLDLSADLVVLSACNTALGKQIQGEGTVGIVRAFLYAGAARVVATSWKVDDEATQELMSRFYRKMFEEQLSPSAALRSAQTSLWRESEWRAPFFWGAFVLQGEWRQAERTTQRAHR